MIDPFPRSVWFRGMLHEHARLGAEGGRNIKSGTDPRMLRNGFDVVAALLHSQSQIPVLTVLLYCESLESGIAIAEPAVVLLNQQWMRARGARLGPESDRSPFQN